MSPRLVNQGCSLATARGQSQYVLVTLLQDRSQQYQRNRASPRSNCPKMFHAALRCCGKVLRHRG